MIQQEEFDFSVGETSKPKQQQETEGFDFSVEGTPAPKQIPIQRRGIPALDRAMAVTGKWGEKITPKATVQFFKPVGEELVGMGEGAVSAASGLIAFIPSLVAGLASKATGKSFEEAEEFQHKIASLLTHEPVTQKGKVYSDVVNAPFAAVGEIINKAAEVGADDPETQAMLRMAGGIALIVGGSYLHGGGKTYVENTIKKGMDIARAKKVIKKSADVPKEIKTVVEKLPDDLKIDLPATKPEPSLPAKPTEPTPATKYTQEAEVQRIAEQPRLEYTKGDILEHKGPLGVTFRVKVLDTQPKDIPTYLKGKKDLVDVEFVGNIRTGQRTYLERNEIVKEWTKTPPTEPMKVPEAWQKKTAGRAVDLPPAKPEKPGVLKALEQERQRALNSKEPLRNIFKREESHIKTELAEGELLGSEKGGVQTELDLIQKNPEAWAEFKVQELEKLIQDAQKPGLGKDTGLGHFRLQKAKYEGLLERIRHESAGRAVDLPPAKPEVTKPSREVVTKKEIPSAELSTEQLVQRIKAKYPNEEAGALYGRFVQERNLKPEINAKQFGTLLKQESPNLHVELSKSAFEPTHYDTLTNRYVQATPEEGVVKLVWEDGTTGSEPVQFFDKSRYKKSAGRAVDLPPAKGEKTTPVRKSFDEVQHDTPVIIRAHHGSSAPLDILLEQGFRVADREINPLTEKIQGKFVKRDAIDRQGFLGRGVYFTDSKAIAKKYGIPHEVDVSLKKPYVMGHISIAELRDLDLNALKAKGYDGIVVKGGKYGLSGESYRQGVVFNPEQITVATKPFQATTPMQKGAKVINKTTGETGTVRGYRLFPDPSNHPYGDAVGFLEVRWNGKKGISKPRTDLNVLNTDVELKVAKTAGRAEATPTKVEPEIKPTAPPKEKTFTRDELFGYGKSTEAFDKIAFKNAGYNIIEEIKKSIQFLKGEDPYKLTKEQIQKEGKSLEPSTSPTLKKILGEEPVEPPMPDAGQIIYDAIKEAKPLRTEQEAIYSTERGKKMAMGIKRAEKLRGKERAEAFRKAQAGKMKKLDFEQPKVPTEAIEEMYDRIWDSPAITEWERLSANSGLTKLLEGKIPQEGEIILLDRVFPKSLTEALKKKRSTWQRVKYGLLEVSGIPRALMASWDFSAPFRQGVFLATRYPKQFFKSFVKMFDMWRSEESYKAVHESITQRETYPLMRQGELALTELDSILRLREEAFMSHWAEKIPLVRRSGRAYTGFLNLLRADVFDTLIKSAEKMGHNPQKSAFLVKSLANFINVASGRGSLKSVLGVNLEKSAVLLNQVLFSPRLMSSRFKLLNPAFYIKAHPFVRRQALQSLLAFVGAGTTVLTLLKAAGAEVELDPTSSKFGKASIGNTTIDIWGGFQQYVRTGAQLAFGQTKSASTGKKTEVKGARLLPYPRLQKGEKGPFAPTSLNIAGRWLEYKQAPLLSFATDLLRGSTAFGEELDFGTTDLTKNPVAQRFIPMVMQDMIDIYKDDPSLLPVSLVGLFGVGLQTYEPRKSKGGVRW